jgi:hypothetical protein
MEYLDTITFTFEDEGIEKRYQDWILKHTAPELAINLATALVVIYILTQGFSVLMII